MKTNRIILTLIALTFLLQATMVYRLGVFKPSQPEIVRGVPEGSVVEIANMPVKGSPAAQLVLIEFSDYQCPFCKRHATTVRAELWKRFVETGRLRYAFGNNPLPIHPNAGLMATAAICAGEQGHFWEMHDSVFAEQPTTRGAVLSLIRKLDIDHQRFEACLEGTLPTKQIERDMKTAEALGLAATPAFALGRADSRGNVEVKTVITGAVPLSVFEKAIDNFF